MRRHATESLPRLLAAPAASGLTLALLLVMACASAMEAGPLLFTAAHGLGAVMLVVALSGLIGCAAFGTGLGLDEGGRDGGVPARRPVPVTVPGRARRRPH